ncbi:MAG: hypothetical protein JSV77_10175 [Dehalococcoidales bacterium]|nr:MAG: hypothetical protein JSV77_10175 [Dehalococcoidales bacterium]
MAQVHTSYFKKQGSKTTNKEEKDEAKGIIERREEMKRKILLLGIVIALILTMVMPATALAAKPSNMEAFGIIDSITIGDDVIEFPAGQSGRWVVKERAIGGVLGGYLGGDIDGDFTLTYKANVVLATQAGTFHGDMVVGDYVVHVNGKSSIGATPIPGYDGLILSGHWNFTGSDHGNGTFDAWIIPLIEEGHIIGVIAGGVTMTGKWKP